MKIIFANIFLVGVVLQPSNLGLHEFDHAANPERFMNHYCGDAPFEVIYVNGREIVREVKLQKINPELEQIMEEHSLSTEDLSQLLGVSFRTAYYWRQDVGANHAMAISQSNLTLLKRLLEQ